MIKIMNLRKAKPSKPYDFYIDRHSPVGNPFGMLGEPTRDLVCEDYEQWFGNQLADTFDGVANPRLKLYLEKMASAYEEHGELRLFCWCAPKRCHGETIKAWIEKAVRDGLG